MNVEQGKRFAAARTPEKVVEGRWKPAINVAQVDLEDAARGGGIWMRFAGSPTAVLFADALSARAAIGGANDWAPRLLTDSLSNRELQAFVLLARGFPNRSIAQRMFCSPKTVSTYFVRIQLKTGLLNVVEMGVYAHMVGLTSWPFDIRWQPAHQHVKRAARLAA